MPARTIVIGLDGVDPFLLERWSSDGTLPWLASFARDAAVFRLANALDVIGGGVWQELGNGRSCGRAGIFFPARQLRTGEATPRQIRKDEVDPRGFWTVASDAGRRVAVVDVPHTVCPPAVNGLFVTEWGTHDRLWGEASSPEGLYGELRERHGDYPLWRREWPRVTTTACDGHDASREQYEQLLDDLLAGVERKTQLLLDVLGRDDWDLFACGYSEGQCSGHQLWHFLDLERSESPDRLAGGIKRVYEQLDAGMAELVRGAGPDATVFLLATHAYADPTGGQQLLPDVVARLGYGSGGHGLSVQARSKVPPIVRRVARRALPRRATQSLQARVGSLANPLESPNTRAAALDGDRCGWIRLNLEGREPLGSVAPGAEAEQILEDIRTELLRLEDPRTGSAIVSKVLGAEEAFGPEYHPDVPDLLVHFRADLGRLDACRSERVGLVEVPYSPPAHRTGAHPSAPSVLWLGGPGIPHPVSSNDGLAVDLAPTILSQLGVAAPDWMDGASLV